MAHGPGWWGRGPGSLWRVVRGAPSSEAQTSEVILHRVFVGSSGPWGAVGRVAPPGWSLHVLGTKDGEARWDRGQGTGVPLSTMENGGAWERVGHRVQQARECGLGEYIN